MVDNFFSTDSSSGWRQETSETSSKVHCRAGTLETRNGGRGLNAMAARSLQMGWLSLNVSPIVPRSLTMIFEASNFAALIVAI